MNSIEKALRWKIAEIKGQTVKEVFDSLAKDGIYDRINEYDRRVKLLRDYLSGSDGNYSSALDLGCGTGMFIDALLKTYPGLHVVGADLSENMLRVAKNRFPNVNFVAMNFCQGLFPRESFDLITMSYGLRFVPRGKEKDFVQNITDWLKVGGRLILVDLQPVKFVRLQEFVNHCLWKEDNLPFKRETYFINTFGAKLRLLKISSLGQERPLAKTIAYSFEKR